MKDNLIKSLESKKQYDIFLSYHGDQGDKLAKELKDILNNYGIQAYYDQSPRDPILFGTDIEKEIENRINCSRFFFPLITENYHDSQWTCFEAKYALSTGCIIIPVYAIKKNC